MAYGRRPSGSVQGLIRPFPLDGACPKLRSTPLERRRGNGLLCAQHVRGAD